MGCTHRHTHTRAQRTHARTDTLGADKCGVKPHNAGITNTMWAMVRTLDFAGALQGFSQPSKGKQDMGGYFMHSLGGPNITKFHCSYGPNCNEMVQS